MKELVALRGSLPKGLGTSCFIIGSLVVLALWSLITETRMINPGILPSPRAILFSLPELYFNNALLANLGYSIKLNFLGLLEASLASILLGFAIGLTPFLRYTFEPYMSCMRFAPLTAITGIFLQWFGIGTNMKVQFLAFSIFLYLLPAVIQRIDEVEDVYLQTAKTIGAKGWQTIIYIFLPSVFGKVFDDIKNLSALSWTYIVVAEIVNMNGGGVGALAAVCARQSRTDKVFCILIIIMVTGLVIDSLFKYTDKLINPWKYATKERK